MNNLDNATSAEQRLRIQPHNVCPPVGARLMFYRNGEVVQQSRNLRGIIERARLQGVHAVSLFRTRLGVFGPGEIFVEFQDGSTVRATFAEHGIARAFFRKRYQRWGLSHEVRCSDTYTVWQ